MDYSDRRAAERVASTLLLIQLPNQTFRRMHHRETLKGTEGITEHVRWLRQGAANLRGDQKVLARRLHALLDAWFEHGSWDAAAAVALAFVPKQ